MIRIIKRAIATMMIEIVDEPFSLGVSVSEMQLPSVQHKVLSETGRLVPEHDWDFRQTSPLRSAQDVSDLIEVIGIASSAIDNKTLSSVREVWESAWIPPSNSPETSDVIEKTISVSSPGSRLAIVSVCNSIRSFISSETSKVISPVGESPELIRPRVICLISEVLRVSSIVFEENCNFDPSEISEGSITFPSSSIIGSWVSGANSCLIT